jgi:hypothetical protein
MSGDYDFRSGPGIANPRGPADQQHGTVVDGYPWGGYAKMPVYNQAFTTPLEFATTVIASFFAQNELISFLFPQIPTDHVQIRWEEYISVLTPFAPTAPQAPAPETYIARRALEGSMQAFAQQYTLDDSIRGTKLQDLYSSEHARNLVSNMHLTVFQYVMGRLSDIVSIYGLLFIMMGHRSGVASSIPTRIDAQLSAWSNMTGCINRKPAKTHAMPYIAMMAKKIVSVLSPWSGMKPDFMLLPEGLKEYMSLQTDQFDRVITEPMIDAIMKYVDAMVPGARDMDFARIMGPIDMQHFEHMIVRFLGPLRVQDNHAYDVLEQTMTFGTFGLMDPYATKIEFIDYPGQRWTTVLTRKNVYPHDLHEDARDGLFPHSKLPPSAFGQDDFMPGARSDKPERGNQEDNDGHLSGVAKRSNDILQSGAQITTRVLPLRFADRADEQAEADSEEDDGEEEGGGGEEEGGSGDDDGEGKGDEPYNGPKYGSIAALYYPKNAKYNVLRSGNIKCRIGESLVLPGAWYIIFRPHIQLRGHGMYIGVRGEKTGVVFIGRMSGPTQYHQEDVRRHTTFMQFRVGFILMHPEHIARIPGVYFSDHVAGGGTRVADQDSGFADDPLGNGDFFIYEVPQYADAAKNREFLEQLQSARFLNSSGVWRPPELACLNDVPEYNWLPNGLIRRYMHTNQTATNLAISEPTDIQYITDYGLNGAPTELMARGKYRLTYEATGAGRLTEAQTVTIDGPAEQGPLAPSCVTSIETWRGGFPAAAAQSGPMSDELMRAISLASGRRA